jgi:hypothetical protein
MLKNGILNLPKDSLVPFLKKLFFEENILKISTLPKLPRYWGIGKYKYSPNDLGIFFLPNQTPGPIAQYSNRVSDG